MLNKVNLARMDLNLLVLFEAVFEELHVARAAARLHVSASAVSHGLGRLRGLLRDPLFLRHPKGVVPTERARALAGPVAEVLERARQVMAQAEPFDPARSRRRFLLGGPDAVSAVLLPPLLATLRRDAPGIDLGVRNLVGRGFEQALAELDARALDVALMPMADVPARFVTRALYHEDFVLVMRPDHPLAKGMTLAGYAAAPHLVVSESGDPQGPVDTVLAKKKLTRRAVLTVPNFFKALAIVAESDLVGAMPRHFVAKHAGQYRVVAREPPVPLMSAPVLAVVPQVALRDRGLSWFLDAIEAAARAAKTDRRRKPRGGTPSASRVIGRS